MSTEKFRAAVIYGTMFLMPIIFVPGLRDMFALPRVSLLRAAALVLFGLLIFRIKEIKLSKPDFLIFLYLLVNVSSTVFSVSPGISWSGRYLYYFAGLMQMFCFLIFYLAVRFQGPGFKNSLYRAVSYSAAVVSFYGLIQFIGWDFMKWNVGRERIFSTFGNPDFLAGFLVISVPLVLRVFLRSISGKEKLFLLFIVIASFFTLMMTKSRAGWLGFLASVFVLRNEIKILSGRLKILFLIFVIIAGLFIGFGGREWGLETPGIKSRLTGWNAALKSVRERPITGYGPDTLAEAITPYLPDEYSRLTKETGNPGYAHNIFLDIAVFSGIPGLVLFALILFGFFRNTKDSFLRSALAGFVVYGFFSICGLAMWLYFWVFLASGGKDADAVNENSVAGDVNRRNTEEEK